MGKWAMFPLLAVIPVSDSIIRGTKTGLLLSMSLNKHKQIIIEFKRWKKNWIKSNQKNLHSLQSQTFD